jgi:uncharacterized protein YlzI (FlbEa/FlbD family)
MLIKLNHFLATHELWVDGDEIIIIEKERKPDTTLIVPGQDEQPYTVVGLKSGRAYKVLDTPEEIVAKIAETYEEYDYPEISDEDAEALLEKYGMVFGQKEEENTEEN